MEKKQDLSTEALVAWLRAYADSGIPYVRYKMIMAVASRLEHVNAQYVALAKDAAKAGPDTCRICKFNEAYVDKCECDCTICDLDCKCRNCKEGSEWKWRGEA